MLEGLAKLRVFAITLLCVVTVAGTASAQMDGPRVAPGLDGKFLQIASQVPGFGGYFFDANGDLNVYLTDLTRAADARSLVADVARDRPQRSHNPYTAPAQIIVRQTKYDFPTLYGMRTRLASDVANVSGVTLFDSDEVNNRVYVGVTSEEARQAVLSRIAALELPHDAVAVEVIPEGRPATTLSDNVRPVVGGLEIDYLDANDANLRCTLGVNVWYGNYASIVDPPIPAGTPGFFTASHCSKLQANMLTVNNVTTYQGNSDGTVYTQGGVRIGAERYEPPTFRNAQDLNCLPGYSQCRYSDATFAQYDQNMIDNHFISQGYLAQTLSPGFGSGSVGSTTLSGSQFVNTSLVLPAAGMALERMGWHAGWTEGTVTSGTCVDQWNINSNIWILCSYEVAAGALEGDSGGPVFRITSGNNVAFSGIVWWLTNTGNYFFSHEDNIKRDFGIGVNFLDH